jgi:MFS family permease
VVIGKSDEWWVGSDARDLDEYLKTFQAGGHVVHEVTHVDRCADLLPRRRVFMAGLMVLTSASLFSGFAGNATELIAARATQGLGAALMTPAALSIVMTTYTGAQRTKGLALWGAVGSVSLAVGVLLGGALTTWAGWQLIFWINVPIGAVAFVVALKVLPRGDAQTRRLRPVRRTRSHVGHRRPRRADARTRRNCSAWLAIAPHHRRSEPGGPAADGVRSC